MSNVVPFRKRAERDHEPRRITGEAVGGSVRLEFPHPRATLTVEQAEIWVQLLPQLIATARAQREDENA